MTDRRRAKRLPGTDWFRIIVDLERAGHTIRQIADHIGEAASTVAGWKYGAEPRHDSGQRLLKLHAEVCPKESENSS